jgi:hypothetical protein
MVERRIAVVPEGGKRRLQDGKRFSLLGRR